MIFMSMAIIGVHGMLAGTASMDFSGKKNVGTAVGLIDGVVYLGTSVEALVYGHILPVADAQRDPSNWSAWPIVMVPISLVGLFLTMRLWNARPTRAHVHVTLVTEET
jgi:OPA family glycerol-3-phosphate transporter-like MFS transporter